MPALVHPGIERKGYDHEISAAQDDVGQENQQRVLGDLMEQGREVQGLRTAGGNLRCLRRGHGGIGRRTRLKIAWTERSVGVQVPLPPPPAFRKAATQQAWCGNRPWAFLP